MTRRAEVRASYLGPMVEDIFTEPELDPDGLANLGPLAPMAGIWEGTTGADIHPVVEGTELDVYVEHYELQPIDPQTNGPQLLYGLRYHTHIVKPGEIETYHDQVGYWLWEPAFGNLMQTIAIPRGQTVLAFGTAAKDGRSFELKATHDVTTNGICSGPFLESAFKTLEFRIKVIVNRDDTWECAEDTLLMVHGESNLFNHSDRSVLKRIAMPTPNPLAQKLGSR